ncbi:hypothetical protein G5576_014606 [Homo sapiens]|uniref:HCG2039718, isoform CRA_g n=2 Tax=Homo sapiens TaxID=9606 RepID=K7EN88_HUMAN|nr:hCG2039718, isoform CRA_g [Homo sapiens]KAI2582338.1 hypothetical protein KI723_170804 [Homo sapiens]KAI4048857.1 hypothetical protein G5576_014606 [Homo sapiens]
MAEALRRIQVVHAFDIFQMLDVLQELRGTVAQQVTGSSGTVKVVVVDSVTAVVSPLLGGQQREGLALMMQLARELKTLARDLGMAVVVTNHITRDRDSGRLKPALGRSWSFVPSTRILLDTIEGAGASGGRRMACLAKSSRQSIDSEDSFVPGRRASLSDLTDLEDIEGLTVRQLKEILARNFVNYKGCCEKWELMERVTRLYKDQKGLQHLGGAVPSGLEENLCKICMDSPIDCVLLECGHMVTCTKCGKRMNECPICRQYVIRAVHVFRS